MTIIRRQSERRGVRGLGRTRDGEVRERHAQVRVRARVGVLGEGEIFEENTRIICFIGCLYLISLLCDDRTLLPLDITAT